MLGCRGVTDIVWTVVTVCLYSGLTGINYTCPTSHWQCRLFTSQLLFLDILSQSAWDALQVLGWSDQICHLEFGGCLSLNAENILSKSVQQTLVWTVTLIPFHLLKSSAEVLMWPVQNGPNNHVIRCIIHEHTGPLPCSDVYWSPRASWELKKLKVILLKWCNICLVVYQN